MEHATRVGARIRARRLAAGLSAAALALRAGVTENAIRKIESGNSKEPRFSTGLRIAAALGIEANDLLEPVQSATRTPNLGIALRRIRERRSELSECGAAHVAVFGSVARGEAEASDIDIVIEPQPDKPLTLFDLSAMQQKLERILGVRVDVVTPATLRRSRAGRAALQESVRAF